ncbi:MAG: beta-galactosidase [Acidimicrobiales bacterium]
MATIKIDLDRERAGRLWDRLGALAYGGDYNPEQWDEATWLEDVRLMAEAKVNLVSVGIFGWASLQPAMDRFDFSWLDRVMDLLADGGISVCLATATASPPAWLVTARPDILPVDANGTRLWHGSRQHFCPSSPVFREAAARLVETLAEHFGNHPALAAWHVGNEYGCHISRCYCEASAEDFRRWLGRRYGDLEKLNQAWSTTFWSQHYQDWNEVIPPRAAPTTSNPAQQLDFFRFSSDALLECFRIEKSILARLTPEVAVTTNFLGIAKPVDGMAWAAVEDFVSYDSYPDPAKPDASIDAAMGFDFMRGAADRAPWLLMEQAPSAVNWRNCNRPKASGLYRLWSWQAIAHGSNGALSFQWRASRGGAEKFHSAMVPHGGADHPVFRQVAELGRELGRVPGLASTRPAPAEVALLFDWSSWWALELPSRPSSWLSALGLLRAYYEPLWRAGIAVEVVHPSADLSRYRLVAVPNLYLVEDAWVERLTAFVYGGGQAVVGFFSGIVDQNDIVQPGPYPGAFRDLLGLEIDQFWPLDVDETVSLRLTAGGTGTGTTWSEGIRVVDGEPLAVFEGGELDSRPAITRVTRGTGEACYVGTLPDRATMAQVLGELVARAGVGPVVNGLPEGVEAARRVGAGAEYLFLLNHTAERVQVTPPWHWDAEIGAQSDDGRVELGPRGVAVLRTLVDPLRNRS